MTQVQPDGFLATPATGGGSGVLVLHAWWGLNDTIRGVCTDLAEAGYVAFAPDLYHGHHAETIEEAEALSSAVFEKLDQARADVAAAAAFLSTRTQPPNPQLALIGFSLGAFFALDLSIAAPERVRSVVAFYGTHPGPFETSQAAYLGHFAENDPYEPASEVANLEAALQRAGRPMTFHHYAGTGHWFFEPDRTEAYAAAAAGLAWDRTLAFIAQGVRP